MRFEMRRTAGLADPTIGQGRRSRHAELQQREEEQRHANPERALGHRQHITIRDSVLTVYVTPP